MGKRMPETCWDVFKRRAINLRDWCIWLVDLLECMVMRGLTNPKWALKCVYEKCPLLTLTVRYWPLLSVTDRYCPLLTVIVRYWSLPSVTDRYFPLLTFTDLYCPLLTFTDSYCPLLTVTVRYWPLLTVTVRYWQLLSVTDLYWPLLSVTDRYCCPNLTETGVCPQAQVEFPSIKFHQNTLAVVYVFLTCTAVWTGYCWSCFVTHIYSSMDWLLGMFLRVRLRFKKRILPIRARFV